MAALALVQSPPSARAADIQALFVRAGQPEFSATFDRSYRVREQFGLRSWLGIEDARVVLHISVSPEPFSCGARRLVGGLPGDLMADTTHRQFWHPLKLVRAMVADVKREGKLDFLLTSFVPAAEAVFRAAGFQRFAPLQRHVTPLVWPYPLARRLLHGEGRARLTALPFTDARAIAALVGLSSPDVMRTLPSAEYYTTRMPRQEYPTGTWLLAGDPATPDAMVLVSPTPRRDLTIADVIWRDARVRLAGVLSGVAAWAARQRHRRAYLTTIPGTRLAVAAQRAGFLPRPSEAAVMLLPLTDPGTIPPPDQWALTPFALTGW
ncbi:MAG TPA: hypothetical protein VEB19_15320 [Gemmatimonadaceae bacterium]|nr:hypothetical protein [Gemmatimonadaceae bacterium]